jgi:hypothetical protein
MLIPGNGAVTYYYNAPITIPSVGQTAANAQGNINSASDGSSSFAPLKTSPNLTVFAIEIENLLDMLQNKLRVAVSQGGMDVKNNSNTALTTGDVTARSILKNTTEPLKKSVNGIKSDVDKAFNSLQSFNLIRTYATWGLSGLILLILIVMSIAMLLGKPSAVKGCNLCASPIYILFIVMGILFFILALSIGDVCTSTFETYPPPLAPLLKAAAKFDITDALTIKKNCTEGQSILQIANNLNLLDSNSSFRYQANKEIDKVNFSSIATGFNLDDQINLSDSPTSKLTVLTSLDLSTLNTTQLVTLRDVTLPQLSTELTTIKTLLVTLGSTVTTSGLISLPGSQSVDTMNAALVDLKARITVTTNKIDLLVKSGNGTIPLLIVQVNNMATNIDTVKTQAVTLIAFGKQIPTYYNNSMRGLRWFSNNATVNLTLVIPVVKLNIRQTIDVIQNRLYNGTRCYKVSLGIRGIEQGMCGTMLSSLDSLWLAYCVIGFFAAIAMPALIWSSNVIWAHKYVQVGTEKDRKERKGQSEKKGTKVFAAYYDEDQELISPGQKITITVR